MLLLNFAPPLMSVLDDPQPQNPLLDPANHAIGLFLLFFVVFAVLIFKRMAHQKEESMADDDACTEQGDDSAIVLDRPEPGDKNQEADTWLSEGKAPTQTQEGKPEPEPEAVQDASEHSSPSPVPKVELPALHWVASVRATQLRRIKIIFSFAVAINFFWSRWVNDQTVRAMNGNASKRFVGWLEDGTLYDLSMGVNILFSISLIWAIQSLCSNCIVNTEFVDLTRSQRRSDLGAAEES